MLIKKIGNYILLKIFAFVVDFGHGYQKDYFFISLKSSVFVFCGLWRRISPHGYAFLTD